MPKASMPLSELNSPFAGMVNPRFVRQAKEASPGSDRDQVSKKRVINPATERRVNRTREDVGRLMATRVEGVQHTCHVYAENLGVELTAGSIVYYYVSHTRLTVTNTSPAARSKRPLYSNSCVGCFKLAAQSSNSSGHIVAPRLCAQ